jgi:hypothetical protein
MRSRGVGSARKVVDTTAAFGEEPAAYQVVGGVMAHQADDG